MKTFFIAIGLLLTFSMVAIAQDAQTGSDANAARQAVETYLSGKDLAAKARVIDRNAKIVSVDGKGQMTLTAISK